MKYGSHSFVDYIYACRCKNGSTTTYADNFIFLVRDIVKERMKDKGLTVPERKERDDPEAVVNGRDSTTRRLSTCQSNT